MKKIDFTGASFSASTEYDSNYTADKAFDADGGTRWGNNNALPSWLRVELASAIACVQYDIAFNDDDANWAEYGYAPEDWTFEGSNDDSNWTVLDTQAGQSWSADGTKTYPISNTTAYKYYRINITASNGNDWVDIPELILWRQGNPRAVFIQPYSLPPYIVKNFYNQPYSITKTIIAQFVQLYGLKMVAFWAQRYGDAPVVRAVLDQYYGDAAEVLAVFEQPYRSAYQVRSTHEQPYSLPAPLVKIFEQKYSITAAQVRAIYDQLYAIKNTDLARRAWVQPWLIVDGGLGVRSYSVTVTVDGQPVRVAHVNIEASRDQYAMSCELQLAGQADYLACRIMSELLVTIDSETFHFFVESKSRNRRHGQTTSTVHGLSPAARLDAPYSEPWPDDLSGMASAIADQVAGGLVTIDWQTVDWFIPADTLLAGDATPIQIIRQLAEAAGAVLQSQPDGTLVIEPLYPTPVPDWDTVTPDYTLSDALDFFSTNEDFDHRPGYNLYRVSDQAESLDTVRIEEETISATEKIIRVYQTPWQDDFYLDNSGGTWVIIEPLGIEQKLIEDELVEFVGGEGHTQYPIYGASAMAWLQEPLGTVTMAEDGRLTASVGGESLLRISYHSKCRKYRAIDHQVEPVQIVARETV